MVDRRAGLVLGTLFVLAMGEAGCSVLFGEKQESLQVRLESVAILPMDLADLQGETHVRETRRIDPGAERVVTAQLYGVLANHPRFHVIPDVLTSEALRGLSRSGSLTERARALGRATRADAVLCGDVSRFEERVGNELGAQKPASVAFELRLVLVESGEVIWSGAFDQTQEPLTSNLLNWWMFWRAGPRWFTAAELANLGSEKLIEEMEARLP